MRLLLLGPTLLIAASAAASSVDPVAESIRRQIEIAGTPAEIRIGENLIHASQTLPGFYERRGFRPAWTIDGRLEPRAAQLLEIISGIEAEGLRPTDYHLEALSQRRAPSPIGDDRRVEIDLLLTDAFLLLAAHLVSGRVDPRTFDPEWIATRREVDVMARLERVVEGQDLREALFELRPHHEGYRRLLEALARYRRIEAEGARKRLETGPSIRPGESDPRVPALRKRLAAVEAPATGDAPVENDRYDDALVDAVLRFQRRQGLDDDGVVGPRTLEALNVGVTRRVRQIELNLERWRWLPQELGQRHLLVNIPEFRMYVAEAGEEALSMRVIVGRAARSTPVFSDLMRYLVFSPSWDVPPTILRQDKLPEFRKNPDRVVEQNMRVFQRNDGGWAEVDPQTVDWPRATAATIRLRQRPGPNNALGRVKFMFPNPFNIYLHDTPARELFGRSRRDFSSGCIRLEQPGELAHYLLRENEAWTREAVLAAMESGVERSVSLPRAIPVHIQYWTAWSDIDGEVQFRHDIYGRDAKLDAALRLPPPTEPDE